MPHAGDSSRERLLHHVVAECDIPDSTLDQGIIAMVKARYRKWYLRWTLQQDNAANGIVRSDQQAPSDDDEAHDDEVVPMRDADAPLHTLKPSVRRGIRKLAKIWSEVEPVHIFNCSRKSDILPEA